MIQDNLNPLNKFKVGDMVVRTHAGDGIKAGHIGRIVQIGSGAMSGSIMIEGSYTWWSTMYFKHSKNHIVSEIIKDL